MAAKARLSFPYLNTRGEHAENSQEAEGRLHAFALALPDSIVRRLSIIARLGTSSIRSSFGAISSVFLVLPGSVASKQKAVECGDVHLRTGRARLLHSRLWAAAKLIKLRRRRRSLMAVIRRSTALL